MLSMTTYFDSSKSQRWTLYCVTVTMVTYGPRHVAGSWHQMRWDTRKHHLRGVPVWQSVWGVRCHLLVQTGVESSAFRFVHPHSTTCTTQHSTTCTAQHAQHNTGQRGESDVTFWYRLVLSPLPSGLFNHIAQHSTTQHRSVWGVRCVPFSTGWYWVLYLQVCSFT